MHMSNLILIRLRQRPPSWISIAADANWNQSAVNLFFRLSFEVMPHILPAIPMIIFIAIYSYIYTTA